MKDDIDVGGRLFPMAGVSFLILLVLIATAPALISKAGVKVNVPKAHITETELEEHISVALTREGSLYLDDKPVELDTLQNAIERLQTQDPDSFFWYSKLVLIRADKDLPFGDILEILETAKRAKSQRVAFAILKEKEREMQKE
jgi:biopolymer transport protein ExbD